MLLDEEMNGPRQRTAHRNNKCCCESRPDVQVTDNNKIEDKTSITLNGSYSLAKLCLAWALLIYRGSLGLESDDTTICVASSSLHSDEELEKVGIKGYGVKNVVPDDLTSTHDVASAVKEKLLAHVDLDLDSCQCQRWYLIASSADTAKSRRVWRIVASDNQYHVTSLIHNSDFSDKTALLQLRVYRDTLKRLSLPSYLKVGDFVSTSSAEIEQHKLWTGEEAIRIERCMHDLFRERALTSPHQQAVFSWDANFTYAELDCLSNGFARTLNDKGICTGDIVPICFEKSAWTVVAVLAIMKVGAAFTLTDPQQPISRLKTIVDEVRARYMITSPRHRELGLELTTPSQVIVLDGLTLRNAIVDEVFTPLAVNPNSPMYVIFTSGSTGKPKGVIINHVNYTSGAVPRADIVGYQQGTRVLDFASYAFDVSIDCMLLTLATGGCFCVPSEDERMNDLSNAIRRMKVNMVNTTPSIARVLDRDIIPSLDVLGLGGEAVPARSASEWSEVTRVLVAYGPSECTVGCAFSVHDKNKAYTSLGKGCGGSLWIVDEEDHNRLCPIGAIGELIVSGPVVGPGYVNQHDATARLFVESPEWLLSIRGGETKQRFYKTGDLVRHDPDGSGSVVFVGRKDSQVKLRGQRVELEEVEHHVRQRLPPGSTVVAEVICPAKSNSPVLVAFIATRSGRPELGNGTKPVNDPELIRLLPEVVADLQANIPKYMVPSAFVTINQVPMMVSGKTDRKSLKSMGGRLTWQDLANFGPNTSSDIEKEDCQSTELELKLAELWSRVLGTDLEAGPRSNFFSKGGDSLKAMRLVSVARSAGFSLSVKIIFAFPTLARMAAHLQRMQTSTEEYLPFSLLDGAHKSRDLRDEAARLCGIQSESMEDMYPCTPLQEALMALSTKNKEAYIAQRLLNFSDKETADKFCCAFKQAVRQSQVLRTRIVHVSGQGLLQVVVHEQEADLITVEQQEYLEADRRQGMQLGGRLIRAALILSPQTEQTTFVLTMHHALYDGWSIPLLVSKINRICQNMHVATAPQFALFVRHMLQMDKDISTDYWRKSLEGTFANQFPALPSPEYQTQADSLLEHYVSFPHSSLSHVTLATRIRAAWAVTITEHTGNADIVFGETLTGRNAAVPGIEAIGGPCITTVPLRITVKADASCEELLNQVQEIIVDRMPHEHFGLQHIRQLSISACAACELKTGIVLHLTSEDNDNNGCMSGPANGLVPVDDTEAAKEALQFNSYALMLVITPREDGFLVMASFDSNVVDAQDMRAILTRFDEVFQIMSDKPSQQLSELIDLRALGILASLKNGKSEQPYASGAEDVIPDDSDLSNELTQTQSNPKEALLRRIWTDLLGDHVAATTKDMNFFEIGGDSISAMKLVSELRNEGYLLTVQDIFAHRQLGKMAAIMQKLESSPTTKTQPEAGAALLNDNFVSSGNVSRIRSLLQDRHANVIGAYRARPLQEIAVHGSTEVPRYSMRYEMFHFRKGVDKQRIRSACHELVLRNEILRTSFVTLDDQCMGVVLDQPRIEFNDYSIETARGTGEFAQDLINLDIRVSLPLGSQFVRFWLISSSNDETCLVIRISHSQYDEMCLPLMWQQLKHLYEGQSFPAPKPFSTYSDYVTQKHLPESIPYWKELLRDSKMAILPGPSDTKPAQNDIIAVSQKFSIKARPKSFTVATLPTAAWALCVARRLSIMDVTFGEVVSGRQIDFADAEKVIGPCWQYVPVRVKFEKTWRVNDLLQAVQNQHVASSGYEGVALPEIVEHCTDWPKETSWFDSVVHQAVTVKEKMDFDGSNCRVETCYPHTEPLREWKVQAFAEADILTLEIVTFREWGAFGRDLLNDLVGCFEQLLGDMDHKLF